MAIRRLGLSGPNVGASATGHGGVSGVMRCQHMMRWLCVQRSIASRLAAKAFETEHWLEQSSS